MLTQAEELMNLHQQLENYRYAEAFLLESNKIEGILRPISDGEFQAFHDFMKLEEVTIADLEKYVTAIQPDAVLRNKVGLDVRVGSHVPPKGGPEIKKQLENILERAYQTRYMAKSAFGVHQQYETLHPFTDGNGRSGRMLWWWMMGGSRIGFLHTWYYQSLEFGRV